MKNGQSRIIILNGAPRSGKSSIAAAIQDSFPEPWMNLGVDLMMAATPSRYLPGIGLRPGGERPDLEPFVVAGYKALYDSIASHCRAGINVVADVGHHDAYSKPLRILEACAGRLDGLHVLFVGVRCPLPVVMARRAVSEGYSSNTVHGTIPDPVRLWQDEVHRHRIYDLDVDTSLLTPTECAATIRKRIEAGPSDAMARIGLSN